MHIKLIESQHRDLSSGKRNKHLKESINTGDLNIMRASDLLYDDICENSSGSFSDEDLIQTLRVFAYVRKQFGLTNYMQFYVVYAPDDINYAVDKFPVQKQQSVRGVEVQIFGLKPENYGNIIFARSESNEGKPTLYYFKSKQDIDKLIDYINSNEEEG